MSKVNICGNDYELKYTWRAMRDIEHNICTVDKLQDMLGSGDRADAVMKMLLHLINAAFKANGSKQTVSAEWLQDNLDPYNIGQYTVAIVAAITEGMHSAKGKEKDAGKVHDVYLEEIEKKEEAGA